MIERRAPFVVDEAKFSTQRVVTYVILTIFAAVTANVLLGQDQAERSTIIQTVINFAMLALGFWLGTSKSSADKEVTAARILESNAPAIPRVPLVTPAPATPSGVIPAAEVALPKEGQTHEQAQGKSRKRR